MADTLVPAKELAAKRNARFASESAAYAKAREALLAEEIEVRRHIGRLARQNRELPEGPVCTDFLGPFAANAADRRQHVALAVVSRSKYAGAGE